MKTIDALKTDLKIYIWAILSIVFITAPASATNYLNVEVENKSGKTAYIYLDKGKDCILKKDNTKFPDSDILRSIPDTGIATDTTYSFKIKNEKDPETSGIRIYFSLEKKLEPGLGSFSPILKCVKDIRYDAIELTADGSPTACANLSAVDQIGIPMAIESFKGGTKIQSYGYKDTFNTIINNMRQLSLNGNAVKTFPETSNNIIRAESPKISPGDWLKWDLYLVSLIGEVLTIEGQFNGIPCDPKNLNACTPDKKWNKGSQPAVYKFTGSINNSINLELKGKFTGNDFSNITSTSISILKENLNNDTIYGANGPFTIKNTLNNGTVNTINRQNDVNDAYQCIFRDFMTGINFGMWGQVNNNKDWSFSKAFKGNYYNIYSKIITDSANSYGDPFSDGLLDLHLNLSPQKTDTIKITLLSDDQVYGYTERDLDEFRIGIPPTVYDRLGDITVGTKVFKKNEADQRIPKNADGSPWYKVTFSKNPTAVAYIKFKDHIFKDRGDFINGSGIVFANSTDKDLKITVVQLPGNFDWIKGSTPPKTDPNGNPI